MLDKEAPPPLLLFPCSSPAPPSIHLYAPALSAFPLPCLLQYPHYPLRHTVSPCPSSPGPPYAPPPFDGSLSCRLCVALFLCPLRRRVGGVRGPVPAHLRRSSAGRLPLRAWRNWGVAAGAADRWPEQTCCAARAAGPAARGREASTPSSIQRLRRSPMASLFMLFTCACAAASAAAAGAGPTLGWGESFLRVGSAVTSPPAAAVPFHSCRALRRTLCRCPGPRPRPWPLAGRERPRPAATLVGAAARCGSRRMGDSDSGARATRKVAALVERVGGGPQSGWRATRCTTSAADRLRRPLCCAGSAAEARRPPHGDAWVTTA